MVNPIFDTGVFLAMLILSFILFFSSLRLGTVLLIPAAAMFIILGLVLITGYDVVSYKIITDVGTNLNETNYFIKNTMENGSTQWMGWILLIFGFITSAKFVSDATDKNKPLL